jgi:CDP-diacylglycerol--inositol 3-phosphatidyltransferase
VLFTLCFMNELFFLALYLLAFTGQDDLLAESQITEVIRSEPWSAGAMEVAR